MRIAALLLLCVSAAFAGNLATTQNGDELLLLTKWRVRGQSGPAGGSYVIRFREGQWRPFASEPSSVFLTSPYLSADGAVAGWSSQVACRIFCLAEQGASIYYGRPDGLSYGRALSPNARLLLIEKAWFFGGGFSVTDLSTGRNYPVEGWLPNTVADDGTMLAFTQTNDAITISVVRPGESPKQVFRTNVLNAGARISANGKRALIRLEKKLR